MKNLITKSYILSRDTRDLWMIVNGLSQFTFVDVNHAREIYRWAVKELRYRRDNWV
jgi:hypothetical protein